MKRECVERAEVTGEGDVVNMREEELAQKACTNFDRRIEKGQQRVKSQLESRGGLYELRESLCSRGTRKGISAD